MILTLEHNDDTNIPYRVRLDIVSLTSEANKTYHIPVYSSIDEGRQVYDAEVCGFRVEADTPEKVVSLVEKLLPGLVNMARFPTYMFVARRSRRIYPVYTVGNEVLATTPKGPVFKHVELAKVRDRLSDFLHQAKILGEPGKSDKLHVRGVRSSDLSLTRPLFYLKKRPVLGNENEFWSPVFEAATGQSIYTYAVNQRREQPKYRGLEALRLRTEVAQALIADTRLNDELELRADRFLPEYWQQVKSGLETLLSKLTYNDVECDLYRDGQQLIAVEHRVSEDRYSLYIGRGIDDLRMRAARDLYRRGIISNPDDVQLKLA